MEFMGRTVRKQFKGFGVSTGILKSYDSLSGLFGIGYENGDSEEIDFSELSALVDIDGVLTEQSPSLLAKKPSRVGGRAKKRRRTFGSSNSGNENDFSSSIGNAVSADDSNLDSVEGEFRNEGISVDHLTKKLDFSSNNNNVNSVCDNLNSNVQDLDRNGKGHADGIDLNLDLNVENDLVNSCVKKEECNMDLDHNETKNQDVDLGGYLKRENSGEEVEEMKIKDASNLEVSGEIATKSPEILANNSDDLPVLDDDGNLGKTNTGGRRGKKRRNTDSPKTAAESVLRRSARRRAKLSAEDNDLNVIKYDDVKLPSCPSPVVSAVSEDQPTISDCEESEEPTVLPQKLELPPSTGNLNLDGLPVANLFSVYSFLRSFSTVLFLSPFEFGDFVAAIRSKSPNLLIDSIHVSLLRVLRKQLEFQSSESSKFATNCLRDLNWDLVDLMTWPIFMAEYLLMKPGFDVACLKLHKIDYHKQSEFVKLELLQYICDDLIEAEAISLEINRRIILVESSNIMDPDLTTKSVAFNKRTGISGNSCMSEEVIDETADWNSDECCLCKMDGNLICCDGCPAAFHSKCVGIATNLLPAGDWFCPECVVDKKNPEIDLVKSIRGADLLAVDPHGKKYYSSCGYILVSDICEAETLFYYYHMNDLTALINALNLLNGPYEDISKAITKHWHSFNELYEEKSKLDSENISLCVNETPTEEKSSKTRLHSSKNGNELSKTTTRRHLSSDQLEKSGYLNLYSFARVASSVAGDWIKKPSDNHKASQTPTKSLEELITIQMKAITKTSVDFCWSNMQNLTADARKEKCGWCLACKFPTDDGNCLFFMNNATPLENFTTKFLGFDSEISRNDRVTDVMCHVLYIEERLHGLLLGPWLNPNFPKLIRQSFLEASDITPVKDLLLMIESNIWSRALSDDWVKHVDSVATVGSTSHIVTSKPRVASRNVVGKKRSSKCSTDSEPHSSKNASSGLGLFWWRGGRLTRQLFNWKVLPRDLASKAARQGGSTKIDGVLYPENSNFPKRSKALVWRAAVESAVTPEQLALQIRELDANIKWEEIENSMHLAKMDKESLKSMRSFKKATIRRKISEGSRVKYLVDFGKRRFIPEIVVTNGSKVDDSASERKKFWVEESYVPLFLLRPFEDRRIALKSNKMSLNNSLPLCRKKSKKDAFSYLFSRAEKSQCGHCKKDVLVRDAVSCQYCEGCFHKTHVRKTSGGTYTCHKCHAGEPAKAGPKKGKLNSRKTKKVSKKGVKGKQSDSKSKGFAVPLRRSARAAKLVSLQKKKPLKKKKSGKKKKQVKSVVNEVEKPKGKRGRPRKIINQSFQKKRSQKQGGAYWLNGLLLSRKVDDERVVDFRAKNHLVHFGPLDCFTDRPKCCLCDEPEFRPLLNYINCDTCREWYHGDAFGLKMEQIEVIVGFKCHKCRERPPPTCPHIHDQSKLECADVAASEVDLKQKADADTMSAGCKEEHGPESTHMSLGEPCEDSSSRDVLEKESDACLKE